MRLLAAIFLAPFSLLAADLVVHDPFATSGRLEGSTGGTGFAGPWADGHQEQVAEALVSKLGETPATSGGSLALVSPDWTAKRALAAPIGAQAGSWYLSCLIRNDTGERAENYAFLKLVGGGKDVGGVGKTWMGDRWTLFAGDKESGSQASCANANAVFMVVRYTYADGPDRIQAWIDPDLDSEPVVADVEIGGLDLPPADEVRMVAKKRFTVDELRLGTSWSAVCPSK